MAFALDPGGLAPQRRRRPLAQLGGFPAAADTQMQMRAQGLAAQMPPVGGGPQMPPGGGFAAPPPAPAGGSFASAPPGGGFAQPGLGGPAEYPPQPMPNTKLPWPISGAMPQLQGGPGASATAFGMRKPMARLGMALNPRRRRRPPVAPPGVGGALFA